MAEDGGKPEPPKEWERWNTHLSTQVEQDCFQHTFRLRQDPNSQHLGTTVWDSSIVLAKYLERNAKRGEFSRSRVKGKTCVELGAGMGLGGLAFAMLGAASVVLTDQAAVLPLLRRNYENNLSPAQLRATGSPWQGNVGAVHVAELDWAAPETARSLPVPPPFDFVLAADCVYHEHVIEDLLRTCVAVIHPKSAVLVVNELRSEPVQARFMELFGRVFSIKRILRSKLDPEYSHDAIHLMLLKLKKGVDLGAARAMCDGLRPAAASGRAAVEQRARDGDMLDYSEEVLDSTGLPGGAPVDFESRRAGVAAAQLLTDVSTRPGC